MNTSHHNLTTQSKSGFTLVEIMIVVVIIGILAAMAGVAFKHVRDRSIATTVANDLRVFAGAFQAYALENGTYPADVNRGIVPSGMEDYLKSNLFTSPSPAGGYYDWEEGVFGLTAAVSLRNPSVDRDTIKTVDEILDDGDLSSGVIYWTSGALMYVIEG